MCGAILSDPKKRHDTQFRTTFMRIIPEANARIHDGLDKLEDDVINAQRYFRRELMIMRAEKEYKESVANAKPSAVAAKALPVVANGNAKQTVDLTEVDEPVKVESAPKPAPEQSNGTKDTLPAEDAIKPEPVTTAPAESTTVTIMAELPKAPTPAEDEMKLDDYDGLFDFGETSPNNDNVNSIDMSDFQANAEEELLPGLGEYANMANAVPETTGDNTASIQDMDFGMLGMQNQSNNAADLTNAQDGQGDNQQTDLDGMGDYDGDNTFDDLFDMDYELRMADNAANASELEDWMKTFD